MNSGGNCRPHPSRHSSSVSVEPCTDVPAMLSRAGLCWGLCAIDVRVQVPAAQMSAVRSLWDGGCASRCACTQRKAGDRWGLPREGAAAVSPLPRIGPRLLPKMADTIAVCLRPLTESCWPCLCAMMNCSSWFQSLNADASTNTLPAMHPREPLAPCATSVACERTPSPARPPE